MTPDQRSSFSDIFAWKVARGVLVATAKATPLAASSFHARGAGALSADLWLDVYSANALTRAAGGRAGPRAGPAPPRRLVVDVREFMSSLPAVLHRQLCADGVAGNFLDGTTLGKGGVRYVQHGGLCLETQGFPDAVNQPAFPSVLLQPQDTYRHEIVYRFYNV
ncbi:Aldose 1-epimerase [Tetrabaena socialis]|uniref:Aldose 1-epimerase n=1 Tax=Tetrabaena socialis TaxID=47790 RepID=A0A2J8A339_9CHLO|nr:Aldose 1-epimerase [Tetrabaena socialis]|eukprot:PNH06926.1 Aldose 1-epimerase [Tetrabaena socialis]